MWCPSESLDKLGLLAVVLVLIGVLAFQPGAKWAADTLNLTLGALLALMTGRIAKQ